MSSLRITGGRRLFGEIRVQGAKNSALPILAASILSGGETVITNCPELSDVHAALDILRTLGCRAEFEGDTVTVDSSSMTGFEIPDALMRRMRSSVIFLGAILARCGQVTLSMPGGCELGPRPIDLHLAAMERLGASVARQGGNLICRAPKLKGARVDLGFPSVGATENAMLAVRGSGAGTSTVTVEGGRFRPFVRHRVIPDRIAAATYISAAAAAGGNIVLRGVEPEHLTAVADVFREMGVGLTCRPDALLVSAGGPLRPPRTVTTRPYPGFPTDAQPTLMAACLGCEGASVFVETIFENRYRHVPELARMGADIRVDGRVAIVRGGRPLHGAVVEAPDLRGGAALAVAALAAEGTSEILETGHILRGYEHITENLTALGAQVWEETERKDERWSTKGEGKGVPAARSSM